MQSKFHSSSKPAFSKISHTSENILMEAVSYVSAWENDAMSLDDCLDNLRESDFREKAAVASLLFEYFRHKGFLDNLLIKHAKKDKVNQKMRLLVLLAATQVFCQTGLPWQSAVNIAVDVGKLWRGAGGGSFVNAILRSFLRDNSFPHNNIPCNCSDMLLERWTRQYGEETSAAINAQFASNPPMTFRLRPGQKLELPEQQKLEKLKLDFLRDEFQFYELPKGINLFETELFEQGAAYVQDPATAMGISMIPDGALTKNILDACAAPGGKTLMLAELAEKNAKLFAVDRSKSRVIRMNLNLKRAGVRVKTQVADAKDLPFPDEAFHFILADVPCTNTGVIRRRPDVPWRFSKNRLTEITPLQSDILNSCAEKTEKDGYILYSTCSIEVEENHGRIQSFLAKHPKWTLVRENSILPEHTHDGAYAALLQRLS